MIINSAMIDKNINDEKIKHSIKKCDYYIVNNWKSICSQEKYKIQKLYKFVNEQYKIK